MKLLFRRRWLPLLFCLTLFGGLWDECYITAQQSVLSETLLRLHVRADSDSAAAQGRKLLVRDYLLWELSPVLDGCTDRDEAVQRLSVLLPELEAGCEDFLSAAGMSETVTLSLRREDFPVRQYAAVTLPAGSYTTLAAELGSGGGHNWWCVVWPPLCLAANEEAEEEALAVFSPAERKLITSDGVVIRFRLLERMKKLFPGWFES